MREVIVRPAHRIGCHLDGDSVVVDISTAEQPNMLFLTLREADALGSNLEQILHARRLGWQPDNQAPDEILVADVALTVAEANILAAAISSALSRVPSHVGCSNGGGPGDRVDWMADGF